MLFNKKNCKTEVVFGRKFFKSTAKKHNPSVCRRLYWGFLNSLPK